MFINRFCLIRNFSIITEESTVFAGGESTLELFTESAFHNLGIAYPKFYKMDPLSRLGFLAAEALLRDLPIANRYDSAQVALILANSSGSLDTDMRYAETVKTMASPALFVYTLPNIVSGEICIRHGIRGENAFFILPKFDARTIGDYTELVLSTEKTQACISGWVEVMGEQHDVFLYLTEKTKAAGGVRHSAEELEKIYRATYGKTNSGS